MNPTGEPHDLTFIAAFRPAAVFAVDIDAATMLRIRALMDRIESDEPGLAYAPDETLTESIVVAIRSLIDRGLAEGEDDEGLVADLLTGQLRERSAPARLRIRVRRAWNALRRGW